MNKSYLFTWKNIHFGQKPSWADKHADKATNIVDIESQPWSNSSPSGLDEFVRLACFPSIASKLW